MNEIVDYAHPCMMAEKYLKGLHEAMLRRDCDEAIEQGMKALVEMKIAINAIKHEKEKQVQAQGNHP